MNYYYEACYLSNDLPSIGFENKAWSVHLSEKNGLKLMLKFWRANYYIRVRLGELSVTASVNSPLTLRTSLI